MSAVYGPREATGNDVGAAQANVVDAELDLSYTEASHQRGQARAGEMSDADYYYHSPQWSADMDRLDRLQMGAQHEDALTENAGRDREAGQ